MRRLIQEWKKLGTKGFVNIRARKASDKIRGSYHRIAGTKLVPSRYGVLLSANWQDTTFRFCVNAAYGYDLHNLLTDYPDDFTFFDIGANQGIYSLIACKNPHCKSVYAFEPAPQTYKLLQKNIEANNLQNKITAINAGISDKNATATISMQSGHSGGASLHSTHDTGTDQTAEVQLIDHKELDRRVQPIGNVLVKVDVEGHEETVFLQLARCQFAPQMKLVEYEVDEKWVDPQRLQSILEQAGFNHFERIDSSRSHHYDVVATKA